MTTDTAVLVSSEIMDLGKDLKSLDLVENPEIQTDNQVKAFLDSNFSIQSLTE